MKPPIFVIGSPRSGTSLLRLMLTCHPNIVIPPECGFALWLHPRYGAWTVEDNDVLLADFIADLMRCKKFETWGMSQQALTDFLETRRACSYADLAAAVYQLYATQTAPGFCRWGDKNNYYLNHILEIKTLYPPAVFLHIVKDGRNLACSYKSLKKKKIQSKYAPDLPDRPADAAAHWKADIETIHRAFDKLSWENVYELRFEDLVSSPEKTLRRVCSDLDEAYDSAMLDYPEVNRKRQLEPTELLQWKAKTLEPPIAAEASRYKMDLTSAEREVVETVAGSVLKHYNYL